MKLGIIIDSSSGWTKEQADNKGWGYVPMYMTINGKEYDDGLNIDDNVFYSIISLEAEVSTACASPINIRNVYKKMSKKYDEVIFVPLSNKLSSQNANCIREAKPFKNIHVIESNMIGFCTISLMENASEMAREGVEIQEILKRIEAVNNNTLGMILPVTMDWLKKGGRISKSTAMLGNLLSIIPILYYDGAMEKWGKGRSLPKTMIKATKGLQEILKDHKDEYNYLLLYTHDKKNPDNLKTDEKLKLILKKCLGQKVSIAPMPRLLVIHVGLGTYAIMAYPKKI